MKVQPLPPVDEPLSPMSPGRRKLLQEATPEIDYMVTVRNLNAKLGDTVDNLGEHVRKLIETHEYEYLQAYNIFVKNKERELREFVDLMEKRSDDQSLDKKLRKVELDRIRLREKCFQAEKANQMLKADIAR